MFDRQIGVKYRSAPVRGVEIRNENDNHAWLGLDGPSDPDDWSDEIPDDVFQRDDPLGLGLWGSAHWSDDDPWADVSEERWDVPPDRGRP